MSLPSVVLEACTDTNPAGFNAVAMITWTSLEPTYARFQYARPYRGVLRDRWDQPTGTQDTPWQGPWTENHEYFDHIPFWSKTEPTLVRAEVWNSKGHGFSDWSYRWPQVLDYPSYGTQWFIKTTKLIYGYLQVTFVCTTDVPCHMTLHVTSIEPKWTPGFHVKRGVVFNHKPKITFIEKYRMYQQEPGDTWQHTFIITFPKFGTQRWWYATARVDGKSSSSASQIYFAKCLVPHTIGQATPGGWQAQNILPHLRQAWEFYMPETAHINCVEISISNPYDNPPPIGHEFLVQILASERGRPVYPDTPPLAYGTYIWTGPQEYHTTRQYVYLNYPVELEQGLQYFLCIQAKEWPDQTADFLLSAEDSEGDNIGLTWRFWYMYDSFPYWQRGMNLPYHKIFLQLHKVTFTKII